MVWYSHLFQNFLQFIVIHTVKGFGIVNEPEVDAFLELSCFFDDPVDVGNLTSGKLSSVLSDDLDGGGWEGGPRLRGYICLHIADSLHCTAETSTTV